jgi:hypothetical protein
MHFGWDTCDRIGGEEIVERTAEQRNKALELKEAFSIAFKRDIGYWYMDVSILGMCIFLAGRSWYVLRGSLVPHSVF